MSLITLKDVCGTFITDVQRESVPGVGLRAIELVIKISPSNIETSYRVFGNRIHYEDLNIDEAIEKYNSFDDLFHPELYQVSTVRHNLMNEPGYTPYCGNGEHCTMPRTHFDGQQFVCPKCGWRSWFTKEFIDSYKLKWNK